MTHFKRERKKNQFFVYHSHKSQNDFHQHKNKYTVFSSVWLACVYSCVVFFENILSTIANILTHWKAQCVFVSIYRHGRDLDSVHPTSKVWHRSCHSINSCEVASHTTVTITLYVALYQYYLNGKIKSKLYLLW